MMIRSILNEPIGLPISRFQLRIISLSFNQPNTHKFLSSTYQSNQSFIHQSTHFKLISFHPSTIIISNQQQQQTFKSLSSCFSPQDQLIANLKKNQRLSKLKKPRYQLRLSFSLKIKSTHSSAVVRKSLRKKFVAALRLILQYGVQPIPCHPNLLTINLDLAKPENWLLKDYYYVVHPYVSLHLLTIPQLVPFIQTALVSILNQAKQQQQQSSSSEHNHRAPQKLICQNKIIPQAQYSSISQSEPHDRLGIHQFKPNGHSKPHQPKPHQPKPHQSKPHQIKPHQTSSNQPTKKPEKHQN